jgi:hypothetical protein
MTGSCILAVRQLSAMQVRHLLETDIMLARVMGQHDSGDLSAALMVRISSSLYGAMRGWGCRAWMAVPS